MARMTPKRRTNAPSQPAQATQRDAFSRVRAAHASETAEDYVEAIADLQRQSGAARVVDLARLLGVSHVTVVRTLARLGRQGLVESGRAQGVRLTATGARLARASRTRHEAVVAFLRALGVPARVAEADAEGIEHHVSAATLAAFRAFTKRTATAPGSRARSTPAGR